MDGRDSPGKSLLVVLREAAGLTQEEAAQRAGMSVRGLSNLERGLVAKPRRASLESLAGALYLTDRDRRRLFDSYRPVPRLHASTPASWRGPRRRLRELVGREGELADLRRALRDHDLITVTGPGGCGKTALALAVASAAGRPVTVLALGSLTTAAQLLPALATTLQVRVGSADATLEGVEEALSGTGQLLVVDNAEHLAEAVGELLIQLRGGCPALTVLVTSREPLGMSEELVWRLLPLRAPLDDADSAAPAAELFRRRTREAVPTADLTDAAAIGRVCRRLDGLPLALELAAARVRVLSVPELADRLDRGTDLLTSAVPGPNGRRTLEETIDWSYRMLDRQEQRALAQLSVFRGGFAPDAVEAVLAVDGNPLALAAQLVDRSLLQAEPGGGRYAMLRTIQDYAAARLADSADLAGTRGRHLDHWLERGRRLVAIPGFGERLDAARAMSGELADAEQALAGGVACDRGVEVVELAHMLLDCWNVAPGYAPHGIRWLAVADRLGDRCPPRLRALARTNRAQLLALLGDKPGGLDQLAAAVADADALTPAERTDMLGMLGLLEVGLLDPTALTRADQLAAVAVGCAPGDELAAALSTLVQIELVWGRPERAAAAQVRLGELVATTSGWLTAGYHGQRAVLATQLGDVPAARAALAAALAAADGLNAPRRLSLHVALVEVLLAIDDPEAAYALAIEMPAAVAAVPEVRRKAPLRQVPGAEALRRLGKPGAAAALREGLDAARAVRTLDVGLSGVLVAAAVLRGHGDTSTAQDLAADWQQVRLGLGLPVPPAYRAAVRDLGLDPTPGDHTRARPDLAGIESLLTRAAAAVAYL